MVPGGGIEPPWSCLRRILSPLFAILHEAAIDRKPMHKAFMFSVITETASVQCVAAKCTKAGNEQPSKQPLVVPADFPFGLCLDLPDRLCSLRPVSGCLVAVLSASHCCCNVYSCTNLDAIRSLQDTKPASSTWWLFSPMRGSFLRSLAAISRAPTTPKAYPWDPLLQVEDRQVCG